MSLILRHKKFPLVIMYKDPIESWENIARERLLEEIKEEDFDRFTMIEKDDLLLWLGVTQRTEETE